MEVEIAVASTEHRSQDSRFGHDERSNIYNIYNTEFGDPICPPSARNDHLAVGNWIECYILSDELKGEEVFWV